MRLETLGLDYAKNGDDINETELQLSTIVDSEIREKLEDYKDICKKTVQSENISEICNEKGERILSQADLLTLLTSINLCTGSTTQSKVR